MKNILISPSSFYPSIGGIETITSDLCNGLLDKGLQPYIVTIKNPRDLPSKETINNILIKRYFFYSPSKFIPHIFRFSFFFLFELVSLVSFCLKNNIDIINIHGISGNAFYLTIISKLLKIPLITTTHGEISNDDGNIFQSSIFYKNILLPNVLLSSSVIVACSDYLKESLVNFKSVKQKVITIKNGFHFETVKNNIPRKNVFLAIGRIEKIKNFNLLIDLFKKFPKQTNKYNLRIIGSGSEIKDLKSKAFGMHNIEFFGKQDRKQVMEQIALAKGVLIPSRDESFGLVCLEALALGTPVFASRTGEMVQMVSSNNGQLCNINDLNDVESSFIDFVENIDEYKVNADYIINKYNLQTMIRSYLVLYKEILAI